MGRVRRLSFAHSGPARVPRNATPPNPAHRAAIALERPHRYLTPMTTDASGLNQLGRETRLPDNPEAAVLEREPNPHPDTLYLARFAAPEFTSLCPVTGQPDFAHLVIDYAPAEWLIES